jgi:hypothetical protein
MPNPLRILRFLVCASLVLSALSVLSILTACRPSPVLEAARPAPIGEEFIRLFPDGHAEYGYGVVKENLKAQGGYRYAHDTVWFLAEAFKPHFPAGYLPIKGDVLFMESGLHFKIKTNKLKD